MTRPRIAPAARVRRILIRTAPLPVGLGVWLIAWSGHHGVFSHMCLGAAVIILMMATSLRRWHSGPIAFLGLTLVGCATATGFPTAAILALIVVTGAYVWMVESTGTGTWAGSSWRTRGLHLGVGTAAGLVLVALSAVPWHAGAWVSSSAGMAAGVAALALVGLVGTRLRER